MEKELLLKVKNNYSIDFSVQIASEYFMGNHLLSFTEDTVNTSTL